MSTRLQTNIFLIGFPQEEIYLKNELSFPTNGQVLQHFFYHHKTLGSTKEASIKYTIKRCEEIWPTEIPITNTRNSEKKLLRLWKEWEGIKKCKDYRSDQQKVREYEYEEKLKLDFSLADSDGLKMVEKFKSGSLKLSNQKSSTCSFQASFHLKTDDESKGKDFFILFNDLFTFFFNAVGSA